MLYAPKLRSNKEREKVINSISGGTQFSRVINYVLSAAGINLKWDYMTAEEAASSCFTVHPGTHLNITEETHSNHQRR
jgi:hypothetical protein